MTDMLVELIQNFISGSEVTLNSIFSSMLNLVFHIERELSNLKLADGSFINFNDSASNVSRTPYSLSGLCKGTMRTPRKCR